MTIKTMHPIDTAASRWPSRASAPHIYAVPKLEDPRNVYFSSLASSYEDLILTELDYAISHIPTRWLHSTVQMIQPPTSVEFPEDLLLEIQWELEKKLKGFGLMRMQAFPELTSHSTRLALEPSSIFANLVHACSESVAKILGGQFALDRPRSAHITTGYCHSNCDAGYIQGAINALSPALLYIDTISLVSVTQKDKPRRFEWHKPAIDIPLYG